jgi:hypothetical protein
MAAGRVHAPDRRRHGSCPVRRPIRRIESVAVFVVLTFAVGTPIHDLAHRSLPCGNGRPCTGVPFGM